MRAQCTVSSGMQTVKRMRYLRLHVRISAGLSLINVLTPVVISLPTKC